MCVYIYIVFFFQVYDTEVKHQPDILNMLELEKDVKQWNFSSEETKIVVESASLHAALSSRV